MANETEHERGGCWVIKEAIEGAYRTCRPGRGGWWAMMANEPEHGRYGWWGIKEAIKKPIEPADPEGVGGGI
jgi:hypothetical protein